MNSHDESGGRLVSLALRFWLLRVSGRDWRECGGHRYRTTAFWQAWQDARHTIRQGPHDYKRRGQSNREGANNRRWRRWQAGQNPGACICWPDYAIDARDFAA